MVYRDVKTQPKRTGQKDVSDIVGDTFLLGIFKTFSPYQALSTLSLSVFPILDIHKQMRAVVDSQ